MRSFAVPRRSDDKFQPGHVASSASPSAPNILPAHEITKFHQLAAHTPSLLHWAHAQGSRTAAGGDDEMGEAPTTAFR